jgi:hypothetical protein
LAGLGKSTHEALEAIAEPFRVEVAKQAAECVVAGNAVFQLEKAAQERLLCRRERGHMGRSLTAAQNGAESNEQKFMEVVQTGIAGSRILQPFPARNKPIQLIQSSLPGRVRHTNW